MKKYIAIKDGSVSKIILNEIKFEERILTFNIALQQGIEADTYVDKSNKPESQSIKVSSIISLMLPNKQFPLNYLGTEFGNPVSVFPQPTSYNILPVPLFAIALSSLDDFCSLENQNNNDTMILNSEDAYYLSNQNNGLQLEMFWLSSRFWGSCQWNGSDYKVRVVHAIGPLPVTWRVLQATPLPDDSLLGLVITRCTIPTHVTRPAIRYFSQ